jgi:putative flippase GtrA
MKKTYNQFYLSCLKLKNSVLLKFMVAGGASVVLEMLLLIVMVEKFKIYYLYANGISFILTNIFNYLLSRYWVFGKSGKVVRVEASLFLFVTSLGLIINQIIMWGMADRMHYNYKIAKVVAILTVIVWNFFGKKFLVFSSVTPKKHA